MTFPAAAPIDPLPAFRFAVRFSESTAVQGGAGTGVRPLSAGFQEITGLESTMAIHEYKEGGRNDFTHKFATQVNFGNVTMKRGALLTPDLFGWYDRVRRGSFGDRRAVLIAQLDFEGQVALVWYLSRALPAKYVGPSWNASQGAAAIESLELAHEGIDLVPAIEFGTLSLGRA